MDDVLIYSNNLQQQRQDIRNILEAIRTSGVKVKPSKCEFHKEETEYLGFITNREGIKTDPVKGQAIWDWKTKEQNRHSNLLRILQLLSKIHRRFQQKGKTIIRQNTEEIR